jgi:cytochrome o ubiquinol oxidase subunit II
VVVRNFLCVSASLNPIKNHLSKFSSLYCASSAIGAIGSQDLTQTDRNTVTMTRPTRALFGSISLGIATLLGGCDAVILDPKGSIGADERSIIVLATLLMLIVVVPVIFMVFAFAWKYRASNTRAEYRPNWEHSNKVTAVVALIPCIIVLCLGIITWRTSHQLDPYRPIDSKLDPIPVDVVALDWKWLFFYPHQHIATVNEIAFPVDVPVKFRITSASVMNSFFIPQLGGQIYAMAGMQTQLSLIANHQGVYDGMSANYSGGGFSDMKFKALAMDKSGFENWVAKVKASPQALSEVAYEALAKPSEKNLVAYFSKVDADLFEQILKHDRHEPTSFAMDARVCFPDRK